MLLEEKQSRRGIDRGRLSSRRPRAPLLEADVQTLRGQACGFAAGGLGLDWALVAALGVSRTVILRPSILFGRLALLRRLCRLPGLVPLGAVGLDRDLAQVHTLQLSEGLLRFPLLPVDSGNPNGGGAVLVLIRRAVHLAIGR